MEERAALEARAKESATPVAALALLPGLLCDREIWRPLTEHSGPDREFVVPDFGGGDSIAEFAAAALTQLPERFDLVGFSMGGYVAMQIALSAPERVASLALVDTTPRADVPAASERRRALVAKAAAEGVRAAAAAMVPAMVAERRREDPAVVNPWLDMAERVGADTFARQQEAIITRPDVLPDLHRIACPILIVYGELDEIAPPEDQMEMAAMISGASVRTIPDSGHLSLLEAPAEVAGALRTWLADLASDPKEE